MSFPASPTNGQQYTTSLGTRYEYRAADGAWVIVSQSLGVTGAQGMTGLAGTNGTNGATGLQGATGIFGSTGLRGATGLGATGVQGITGLMGFTGLGATGVQGVTGLSGAAGTTIITASCTGTQLFGTAIANSALSVVLSANSNYYIEIFGFAGCTGGTSTIGFTGSQTMNVNSFGMMVGFSDTSGGSLYRASPKITTLGNTATVSITAVNTQMIGTGYIEVGANGGTFVMNAKHSAANGLSIDRGTHMIVHKIP